jgi:hypothetical protein
VGADDCVILLSFYLLRILLHYDNHTHDRTLDANLGSHHLFCGPIIPPTRSIWMAMYTLLCKKIDANA